VRVPETRRVGDLEVMALTDAAGPFFLPRREAFPAATPADWARADRLDPAAAGPDGGWLLVFRCYTIRGPDGRVILVDTGVGPAGSPASAWAPVPGRLPDRLRDAGIEPGDVDTVVLTHLHGDHTGWSVGPDGAPTFPAARYVLQHDEVAALAALGDSAPLRQVVAPLRAAGQLDELRGRAALAGRRVTAVPTPGHTPGHQSVLVSGGGQRILVTGDVLVHAVQLANPDVAYRYEDDAETARRTRRDVLGGGALLATAHLTPPFVTPPSLIPPSLTPPFAAGPDV
jgi:glyoxylase-like metal-dependent hydrolase (beta-lactamase superfamily II)